MTQMNRGNFIEDEARYEAAIERNIRNNARKTRSAKWNFVFMAETLDGSEPGYRSNRVFDILNENMVFQLPDDYSHLRPLTKKNRQFLWECEEERFVFKACLRKLSSLHRTTKHTSWDTASVSNLHLS